MTIHDPLTCRKCSPEPKVWTEVTSGGRTRRLTGWRAVALVFGPIVLVAFMAGMIVGEVVMAVAR